MKWSESPSVVSDSLRPHGLYSPWNSPGQNTGMGSLSLLQGFLPNPGIKPRSPTLQADYLPAEPPGKPKNTRVDSLSLLQRVFPTQESNQVLLHCRRILYQLSYEGSPQLARNKSEWLDSFNNVCWTPTCSHRAQWMLMNERMLDTGLWEQTGRCQCGPCMLRPWKDRQDISGDPHCLLRSRMLRVNFSVQLWKALGEHLNIPF